MVRFEADDDQPVLTPTNRRDFCAFILVAMSSSTKRKLHHSHRSSSSGGGSHRKKKKLERLSDAQREDLVWELGLQDAVFELTTPGVIFKAKPHIAHVKIQTVLANNYFSLASQASVLCDWQKTLRFEETPQGPEGSASTGSGGSATAAAAAAAATSSSSSSESVGELSARLVKDTGSPKSMVEDLLAGIQKTMLATFDDNAALQLVRTSESPPLFIDRMIADSFWRKSLFELVRNYRRRAGRAARAGHVGALSNNPFFEYVLTRISFLSEQLKFDVPAELCIGVGADDEIFQQKLRAEIERVPRCASLVEFRAVRKSLCAFNSKFHSHFFTVMLLTSKCGGRGALGTRRMYEDPTKCLYFRMLQDVRRDALDQLVVDSMLDRYVELCGLPHRVATFFILGSVLRQPSGSRDASSRVDMGKVKLLVDGADGSAKVSAKVSASAPASGDETATAASNDSNDSSSSSARTADSDSNSDPFALALEIRQSGVMTDVVNVLCDPFEKDEKLLDPGNRATLCKICALGSCLLDDDDGRRADGVLRGGGAAAASSAEASSAEASSAEASSPSAVQCLAQSRVAAQKLLALEKLVLQTREFVSDKQANEHRDIFVAIRALVLPPRRSAAQGSASKSRERQQQQHADEGNWVPPPPVVVKAVLAWVRRLWLSEKHVRVNYALFFLPFVELLHELRQSRNTTKLQLFEVMDIYARAFELQKRALNAESHKNTAAARRQVLALEMLDMMKDGLSRHVLEFVSSPQVLGVLDDQAKIAVLDGLLRLARPPFTDTFVNGLKAIAHAATDAVAHNCDAEDSSGVYERLRKFESLAPEQLNFVPSLLSKWTSKAREAALQK